MNPKAKRQIQDHRPILDQEIRVAVLPNGDRRAIRHLGHVNQDRVGGSRSRPALGTGTARRAGDRILVRITERRDQDLLVLQQKARLIERHRLEADPVPGLELTDLPKIGGDDGRGTHEPAQAGAVGAQDHRHVAREVDRPDRVGVVVNVRGVKAGLAAVPARPGRLGSNQTHARPVGIVVDEPRRGEEHVDVRGP